MAGNPSDAHRGDGSSLMGTKGAPQSRGRMRQGRPLGPRCGMWQATKIMRLGLSNSAL